MTLKELKEIVVDNDNDFYFTFDGKRAGVESTTANYQTTYTLWWGDLEKKYDSFMAVVCDPVFNDESIVTLLSKNKIEIEFS